jgi:recombination protein RecA
LARKIKDNKVSDTRSFSEVIEETFGDNIIEVEDDHVEWIPSGSPSLDISIGGGIPRGRFTEIYAPEGSGKTSLALSICKSAIELGNKVLYVDIEQGLDHDYIEAIAGEYDSTKFILAQPETAEQATAICEMGIQSKEFAVIVLDSVAALSPKKERDADADDVQMALISKSLAKFLRRNAFSVRVNNIAFVFINQVRADFSNHSMFKTYATPGGYALKHFVSLRIQLGKNQFIKIGGDVKGFYSKYTIKKNKVGIPFRSFMFPFMLGKGIDKERDLLEIAELLAVVDKRSGAYYVFAGEELGHGLANACVYIKERPEIYDKIRELALNLGLSKGITVRNEAEEELSDEE